MTQRTQKDEQRLRTCLVGRTVILRPAFPFLCCRTTPNRKGGQSCTRTARPNGGIRVSTPLLYSVRRMRFGYTVGANCNDSQAGRAMRALVSSIVVIGSLGAARVLAQPPIPLRSIGPIVATSTENVGPGVTVRATSDGYVLVAAGARKRVYEFDSTLHSFTIIRDSATGTSTRIVGGSGLIPYMGDSTLLPDIGASALLVLDPTGKQVRSIAPPSASDLSFLDVPSSFGHARFDKQGRLVYHALLRTSKPAGTVSALTPDSAPLLRGDFDSRKIDTLGWLGLAA